MSDTIQETQVKAAAARMKVDVAVALLRQGHSILNGLRLQNTLLLGFSALFLALVTKPDTGKGFWTAGGIGLIPVFLAFVLAGIGMLAAESLCPLEMLDFEDYDVKEIVAHVSKFRETLKNQQDKIRCFRALLLAAFVALLVGMLLLVSHWVQ